MVAWRGAGNDAVYSGISDGSVNWGTWGYDAAAGVGYDAMVVEYAGYSAVAESDGYYRVSVYGIPWSTSDDSGTV